MNHHKPWIALTLCLLAVSCTSGSNAGPDRTSEAQLVSVPCESAIEEVADIGEGRSLVLDAVGIWTADLAWPGPSGRQGPTGTPIEGLTFVKFGLPVAAASQVKLEVAQPSDQRILMEWGSVEPSLGLSFGPCPGEPSRWIVFAGGLWVEEPVYLRLNVTADDRSATHDLGIGEPCGLSQDNVESNG